MPPKHSPSDARNAIREALRNNEEIEKTEKFWEYADSSKYEAVTKRASALTGTAEGQDAVDKALEQLLVPFAQVAGWRTLQAIPQGREMASRFKTQLRDLMAQALASSGPLNGGYGLQSPPPPDLDTPATLHGQVEEDGLLTPGSTPGSASDIDNEADGVRRALALQRGSTYEAKMRAALTLYQGAHQNDAMKPFYLCAWKLLSTYKQAAQRDNVWNVFSYPLVNKLPFDDPDIRPTKVFVGTLIKSLCPHPGISPDFLRDMDNHGAVTAWLFSDTIELLYKFDRPEVRAGQPYYLPASCTRLLDARVQTALHASNHSLEQLYQDVRAKKEIGVGRCTDVFDWHAFRIPETTTRMFFYCNPGASANHWIVTAGDVILNDDGRKSGKITIYNSLGRDIDRRDALKLQKFFCVISAVDGSPLRGIDWMSAPVVSGSSCIQANGNDCGLIALENLQHLAHGDEPSEVSPLTALDRRQIYMERALTIVSEWSGITVDIPRDRERKSNELSGSGLGAVLGMIELYTLQHWQYMIVQAQPHLANDFAGQRTNIERLYPRILTPETVLGPIGPVSIPDNALPRVALVLNDHDIAVARPSLDRKAQVIIVIIRKSRFGNNGSSQALADKIVQNHIDTCYPGCDLGDFTVHFVFLENMSSNCNFLGLQQDGSLDANRDVNQETLNREIGPVLATMRQLNFCLSLSGEHAVGDVLQPGEDGSTTRPKSLQHISKQYPNVDLRMCIVRNSQLHDRQPVDGACHPDHTGQFTWAYYWIRELAAKAEADQFSAIGPHLDAHNQMVYLMTSIGTYKEDGAGVLSVQVRQRWPLECLLTSYGRNLNERAVEWAMGDARGMKASVAPLLRKCNHSEVACLIGHCAHSCCWGFSSNAHFEQHHGSNVVQADFFSDPGNFIWPMFSGVSKRTLEEMHQHLGIVQTRRRITKAELVENVRQHILQMSRQYSNIPGNFGAN
jgi:hypothetical protein